MKLHSVDKMLFALCVLIAALGFYNARALAAPADDVSSTLALEMKTSTLIRPPAETPREPHFWITPEYVHYWQNTTTRLPQLLSIANGADTAPVANFYGNQGI